MAYRLKLKCPSCAQHFSAVVRTDDDLPDTCPHCAYSVAPDPDFVPTQMNIQGTVSKAVDQTYRQLEAQGQAQYEMTGNPAMKITNLKDNLREGDVAAMPVQNPVTDYVASVENATGEKHSYFQQGVGGHIAAAQQGPERRNGGFALDAIQGGKMRAAPQVTPTVAGMAAGWGGGA